MQGNCFTFLYITTRKIALNFLHNMYIRVRVFFSESHFVGNSVALGHGISKLFNCFLSRIFFVYFEKKEQFWNPIAGLSRLNFQKCRTLMHMLYPINISDFQRYFFHKIKRYFDSLRLPWTRQINKVSAYKNWYNVHSLFKLVAMCFKRNLMYSFNLFRCGAGYCP